MTFNSALLDGIVIFVEVVEAGGFTAAARKLNHSASHISKEIGRLEERLDTRLLNRTTRSISLTEVGRAYYDKCRQIVADADDAENSLASAHDTPSGLLRVSAPVSLTHFYLNTLLPQFLNDQPKVVLDIEVNDRIIDIVADGFDVVIRTGSLADSDLIAVKIMESTSVTVVAPDYLARNGAPEHPGDLIDHTCIAYAYKQLTTRWEYPDADGSTIGVNIAPRAICNSAETELALAKAGVGITQLPSFACAAELEGGALVQILAEYQKPPTGIYAVYPARAHLSAKVRVFVDFLVERLGGLSINPTSGKKAVA